MTAPAHIRIYTVPRRIEQRFWKYVERRGPQECWEWTGAKDGNGYGHIKFVGGCNIRAHRLSYFLAHRKDPAALMVCHACDNRVCVNPAHLWLGTGDENMADMATKGRAARREAGGEKNGNAKLTAAQIETVKGLIRRGRNNTEIARMFGVTHQAISRIRRGKAWGDKPMQERYASLRGVRP